MSVLLTTYRSGLAALADSSDATYVDDTQTNLGGIPADDVPLEVVTPVSGTPGAPVIDQIVVLARAVAIPDPTATIQDTQLTWKLGVDFKTADVVLTDSLAEVTSGPITHRPDGGDWQWADLLALTRVGVIATASLPPGRSATLRVSEIWIDVYGQDITVSGEHDLLVSDAVADLKVGDQTEDVLIGDTVVDLGASADLTRDVLVGDATADMEAV